MGADESESVRVDECLQTALAIVIAEVPIMPPAGHELDHASGIANLRPYPFKI